MKQYIEHQRRWLEIHDISSNTSARMWNLDFRIGNGNDNKGYSSLISEEDYEVIPSTQPSEQKKLLRRAQGS